MEEKRELRELLERIDQSTRKQAGYAKLQCILSGVAAICCGGLIVLVCTLMPQLQELIGQMETVMVNLEGITEQLAGVDLEEMVRNVDDLVTTSQSAVEEAAGNLNAINFTALNQAIEDLADVVEPLAKFFNVFH